MHLILVKNNMAQGIYNLNFVSGSEMYEHIKNTVLQYKTI